MSPARLVGYLMIVFSPLGFILYNLWFFGRLPGLDPELAVKIVAYLVAALFFGLMGVLGYMVITAPGPRGEGRGGSKDA
ncbi:MAG: hypothetical protein RMJ28_05550 [Nitrososphaerota archaeon]|nr:hypothetical protein [Nitrososphaerota archaeon]